MDADSLDKNRRALETVVDNQHRTQMTPFNSPTILSAPVGDDLGERISAVGKILGILDLLPAEEPPEDLVMRTLRRIRDAGAAQVAPVTRAEQPVV